jgi:hypothetical protein
LNPPPSGPQFIEAKPLKPDKFEYTVYEEVEYGCFKANQIAENYEIRGEAKYRLCQADGNWTTPSIYCQGLESKVN